MAFTVPPLPYTFDALEPYIDARTMEIHHDKHHGAYVTNLNKALEGQSALQAKSIDDLLKGLDAVPENIRGAVRKETLPRQSSPLSDRLPVFRKSLPLPAWAVSARVGLGSS